MTFRNLKCSKKEKTYTCYDKDALLKMRDMWNTRHHTDKITESDNTYIIWKQLRSRMSDICEHEKCWLQSNFRDLNLDETHLFAPFYPKSWVSNKTEWLKSSDISRLMKHYESNYPEFMFIGPSPIDFDQIEYDNNCVWDDLCNFRLEHHLGRKKYIGIIFNTDIHTGQGIHWISLYIDIPKKSMYFFDSIGDQPPREVIVFMNRILQNANELGMNMSYYINQKKHQRENSECGMYCLYFIISLLEKKHNYDYFQENEIPDKSMIRYRNILFNRPSS